MSAISQGLVLLTVAGLVLNEAIGPSVLMLAIVGWALAYVQRAERVIQAMTAAGIYVWLVPILAMLSYVWSVEPAVTFRAAAETLLTIGLVALMARNVTPRDFITIVFVTLAPMAIMGVVVGNQSYDGMTGATNASGIFENKNTFSVCSGTLVLAGLVILMDGSLSKVRRFMTVPFILLGLVQNVQSRSVATTTALALSILWGAGLFTTAMFPVRMQKTYITGLVIIGAVLLGVGGFIVVVFQDELLALVGKDPTLTGRTELWYHAARFIAENSSLGVGYAAFWVQGHPLAEYLWDLEHIEARGGFHFHSLYYEVAVELGVAGVICGALAILATITRVVQWMRNERSPESIFFFSFIVFILIIQSQGWNIFATFDPWYSMFSLALIYGQSRQKAHLAASANARRPVRVADSMVDPTTG